MTRPVLCKSGKRAPIRHLGAALPLLLIATSACAEVRVGRVEALWLLWLVPALLLFYAYAARKRQALLATFADASILERIYSGVSRPRQRLKKVLVVIGVVFGVLSLAELKYGFAWEDVQRRGVDLVVTLDVSDSMLVEDAETGGKLTRLERAKREITDLLRMLDGDRIGLVAFAGTAFLECPLTLDYGAAEVFLDALDTDLIPVKGTSLSDALRVSVDAFSDGDDSDVALDDRNSRAVILITDGEDHGGGAMAAAERAKKKGVRIFTIGIGRDEGSPIPDLKGGFRKDRRGDLILSKLDEPTLQKIALNTGGRYVRSVTGDVDLEQIYVQGVKATLEDKELGSKRRQRWEDRYQWLLGICLLALAIEPLINERRRKKVGT